MIKLTSLIQESHKYEYGCAMLYFNFLGVRKIHSLIDYDDIYHDESDPTFGLETEPHVTLLFGLHPEVSEKEVSDVVRNFKYDSCKLYNVSTFNNEKYDVLKFDVEGPCLHDVNKQLRELPHTSNFPDYHPHMTIAYLKPGAGKKYVDMLADIELSKQPSYAVYSTPNRTKYTIPIKKVNHFK